MLSRLEVHVLHNLIPLMGSAKTLELKTNIIKAVDLIGKAVHPQRLPDGKKFVLTQRDTLLAGILSFLEEKSELFLEA
jgi:hypothetical protein